MSISTDNRLRRREGEVLPLLSYSEKEGPKRQFHDDNSAICRVGLW